MTNETKAIKDLTKQISQLRSALSAEVGSSTMDLIEELISAEIELESYCNR